MLERLQTSVRSGTSASYIKLAGIIDEDNKLATVDVPTGGGPVFVDCGDIERINSCGVRDWIRWLDGLAARGHHLVLVDCAPPIVAQLNLVANFAGTSEHPSRVRSVQLPYFCARCDEEQVVTVEVSELLSLGKGTAPPECRCAACGTTMDFDDIPESYFAFLTARRVEVDTESSTLLAEFVTKPTGLLRPRASGPRHLGLAPERTSNRPGALPSLLALSSVPTFDGVRSSSPGDMPLPPQPKAQPIYAATPPTAVPAPPSTAAAASTTPHASASQATPPVEPPSDNQRLPIWAWVIGLAVVAALLVWWLWACVTL